MAFSASSCSVSNCLTRATVSHGFVFPHSQSGVCFSVFMPARTMRLFSIASSKIIAAHGVFATSYNFQMVGVDAAPHAAKVVYLKPFWYRPAVHFI
jgi:hypothetical protein